MDAAEIDRIVAVVRDLVATRYVFPELATRIVADVDAATAAGRYAAAADPAALAAALSADLQRANGDHHLRVIHHDEPIPDEGDEESLMAALAERRVRQTMSGIGRIERLAGNVGLLEIEPVLFAADLVGDELAAAMLILRHTAALVLDLRGCVGSDPATVAFVCTYLLPPETHVEDVYDRTTDSTIQFWTLPYVPGPRYGTERPVYVLTSARTFSGGEALAYALKHTGRATLVGEVTRGGAHPRAGVRVHPHLEAAIPVGRSISPVTGTDWEGTGVEPDIAVPAADALAAALAQLAG
jgi:C-terminal processing protease CtpA/Prc